MKSVKAYSALASVYDAVMEHVDYDAWADFALHIMDSFSVAGNSSVLELGCGTGMLTGALLEQSVYSVLATDASSDMLDVARERLSEFAGRVELKTLDFVSGWDGFDGSADVILLTYDGFNYICSSEDIARFFRGVHRHLNDGGIIIFDQSTPANSINNAEYFEDEGRTGSWNYVRRSTFDIESGLHTTEFEISGPSGVYFEEHVQRAWTRKQVLDAVDSSPLRVRAAYDGFSLDPADGDSERIHWVLESDRPADL